MCYGYDLVSAVVPINNFFESRSYLTTSLTKYEPEIKYQTSGFMILK